MIIQKNEIGKYYMMKQMIFIGKWIKNMIALWITG